ncbi:MAG: hypothetical protein GX220_08250, partial [Treponema sp.]|nr:hypothetical protein [Treponema sp.]
ISELTDVDDVEEISEVIDVDDVEEISELTDVDDVEEISEVIDVDDVEEISELTDVDDVEEISEVIDVDDVEEISAVIDVNDVEEISEVDDVEDDELINAEDFENLASFDYEVGIDLDEIEQETYNFAIKEEIRIGDIKNKTSENFELADFLLETSMPDFSVLDQIKYAGTEGMTISDNVEFEQSENMVIVEKKDLAEPVEELWIESENYEKIESAENNIIKDTEVEEVFDVLPELESFSLIQKFESTKVDSSIILNDEESDAIVEKDGLFCIGNITSIGKNVFDEEFQKLVDSVIN